MFIFVLNYVTSFRQRSVVMTEDLKLSLSLPVATVGSFSESSWVGRGAHNFSREQSSRCVAPYLHCYIHLNLTVLNKNADITTFLLT